MANSMEILLNFIRVLRSSRFHFGKSLEDLHPTVMGITWDEYERIIKESFMNAKPISDISSQPNFGHWEHMKTKEVYTILAFGNIEKTLEPSVVYQSSKGQVWIRPASEFFDGRFRQVLGPF